MTKARAKAVAAENKAPCKYESEGGGNQFVRGAQWRLVTPDDKICVPDRSRAAILSENDAETSIFSKRLAAQVRGPNTCRLGLVWRSATPNDYVCVNRNRQREVEIENDNKMSNYRTNGRPFCRSGLIWRLATHDDRVCVRPGVAATVKRENAEREANRRFPEG